MALEPIALGPNSEYTDAEYSVELHQCTEVSYFKTISKDGKVQTVMLDCDAVKHNTGMHCCKALDENNVAINIYWKAIPEMQKADDEKFIRNLFSSKEYADTTARHVRK